MYNIVCIECTFHNGYFNYFILLLKVYLLSLDMINMINTGMVEGYVFLYYLY